MYCSSFKIYCIQNVNRLLNERFTGLVNNLISWLYTSLTINEAKIITWIPGIPWIKTHRPASSDFGCMCSLSRIPASLVAYLLTSKCPVVAISFLQNTDGIIQQRFCIQFCQTLNDSQVETFGGFSRLSAKFPWSAHTLRNSAIPLNMAAHLWRVKHLYVGHQHTIMIGSLTKFVLWSCRTAI